MQSQIVQDVPNMFWILFYVSLLFMCYITVFFFFFNIFFIWPHQVLVAALGICMWMLVAACGI